jgi:hypothetical protein
MYAAILGVILALLVGIGGVSIHNHRIRELTRRFIEEGVPFSASRRLIKTEEQLNDVLRRGLSFDDLEIIEGAIPLERFRQILGDHGYNEEQIREQETVCTPCALKDDARIALCYRWAVFNPADGSLEPENTYEAYVRLNGLKGAYRFRGGGSPSWYPDGRFVTNDDGVVDGWNEEEQREYDVLKPFISERGEHFNCAEAIQFKRDFDNTPRRRRLRLRNNDEI